MKPDATNHNPCPRYLRALREHAGLTQSQLAQTLGMGRRAVQYYEVPEDSEGRRETAPYQYQWALECLAGHRDAAKIRANIEQQNKAG